MPFEIIPHGTQIDFIGRWKWCVAGSIAVIALGLAAIPVRGLHWGIDFAGGTEVQVRFSGNEKIQEGAVRAAVKSTGVEDPSVVRFAGGEGDEFLIRFSGAQGQEAGASPGQAQPQGGAPKGEAPPPDETQKQGAEPKQGEAQPQAAAQKEEDEQQGQVVDHIKAALAKQIAPVEVERVEYVGPKVGADLRRAGTKAMLIAFALILIYVGFRFSSRFAPGAIIALIHDVLVTSAIWVMLGESFDLQVLAALLAIVGYSINDTIIIYDRIRETMAVHTAHDLSDVINRSVNATLSRTILTSGLTLLTVLALLLFGGPVIFPFSATMAIGIVVGTYSSVYIASPVMLILEQRFGDAAASGAAPPTAPARRRRRKGREEKGGRAARA